MLIKTLTLTQFKGITGSRAFGPLNILVGPNRSGKTAHAQAIQLALTGAVDVGATLDAIQQLGGATGLGVQVQLDDGFGWSRELRRDNLVGSLSRGVKVFGREQLGLKEAQAAVVAHVGDFATILDVSVFLGLSADRRRDYVLDLCSRAMGVPIVATAVWNDIAIEFCREREGMLGIDALKDAGLSAAEIVRKLPPEVQVALGKIEVQIIPTLQGDLSMSIQAALVQAKEITSASRQAAIGASESVRTMTDRRQELQTVAESTEEMSARIEAHQKTKDGIVHSLGAITGIKASEEDLRTRIQQAGERESKWQMTVDALGTDPDSKIVESIREAEQKEQASREVVGSLVDVTQETVHAKQQEAIGSTRLADQARRLVVELKEFSSNAWRRVHSLAETVHDGWGGVLDDCPEWASLRDQVRGNAERQCPSNLPSGALLKVNDLSPEAERRLTELEAVQLQTDRDATNELAQLTKKLEATEHQGSFHRRAGELKLTLQQQSEERLTASEHVQTATKDRTDCERQLVELTVKAETGVGEAALQEQLGAVHAEILALGSRIDAKRAEVALVRELTVTIARATAERVLNDVSKKIESAIKILRERLMLELISPLLVRINHFLKTGEPGSRAYCELVNLRQRPIFELGLIQDGRSRVSLPAMSGGQSCVFCTALLFALMDLADPPLKIVIVEVDRADVKTFPAIIGAIEAMANRMVGGVQVFVLTHRLPQDISLEAWDVHVLGEPIKDDRVVHEIETT
jgi:hypothetical protein